MTNTVTSADGTTIAYDRLGSGPPIVIVAGLFCDRRRMGELAEALAADHTVLNYDRRGRNESGDTPPYAVEREIDDLGAVLTAAAGSGSGAASGSAAVAVYGHSSGAGLALRATAAGLPVGRLVLHEPPYGGDDEASVASARQLAEAVSAAIAEDRRADAIAAFFASAGMPAEMAEAMGADPSMLAIAPTMPYDFAVMGDFDGGRLPVDLVRSIDVPTLVLAGGASEDFFRDTATRLADLLVDGELRILDGCDHAAPPSAVAPVVTEFLRRSDR